MTESSRDEERLLGGAKHSFGGAKLWGFLLRYVCPIAVVIVLIFMIVTGEYL